MNLIVFDLEWNIGYQPKTFLYHGTELTLRGEIIQIGAARINDRGDVLDTFEVNLKPHIFRKLQHHIAKVTGLSQGDLDAGLPMKEGLQKFLDWAGDDAELARLMDGTRTLARLVAEFVRISGRLAPDQVRRVVADLAGNRMLEELPVDAFRPLARTHRRPWPLRIGRAKWHGGTTDWWRGDVDEVRVFQGALTDDQIFQLIAP